MMQVLILGGQDAAEINGATRHWPVRVQRARVGPVVQRASHPRDVAVAHLVRVRDRVKVGVNVRRTWLVLVRVRGRVAHARGDPRLLLHQGHAIRTVDGTCRW